MLERLTHNFRLFLRAFKGDLCPLCAVRASLEARTVGRLGAKGARYAALCGRHLETCATNSNSPAIRVRLTRKALEAIIAGRPRCPVCEYLTRVEARLAQAIRRLDGRMRFRKALEMAPLFCIRHTTLIVSDFLAVNFAQVQRAKLQHLRDALAQAELLNRESLESLTLSAIAYLGSSIPEQSVLPIQDTLDVPVVEGHEFERWDDELQLKHLGDLESEAASLRYRNSVLSEENRRLKLAHVADEAVRLDLERDRAQLLIAAKEQNSNPLGLLKRIDRSKSRP